MNNNTTEYTILFDATLKTKRGHIPYYDELRTNIEYQDQEVVDIRECYGRVRKYKLLRVDDTYYIAVRV